MNEIILASNSPRRYEIMKLLGEKFIVDYIEIDETINELECAEDNVERLATLKAQPISVKYKNNLIIAADTVVCMDKKIIGKPKSISHAREILCALSGKSHEVITGVCLLKGNTQICFHSTTLVSMNTISNYEIDNYINTNNPMDKAGAYGIQDQGALFIKEIKGDFYNVMGLPINKIYSIIKENRLF